MAGHLGQRGRIRFAARSLSTVLALLLLGTVAASAGPTPMQLALKPGQVGPGYKLQLRNDTNCLHRCVTLDLCGGDFLSEVVRTGRYQVDYRHSGRAVQLSNEVVTYRHNGTILARDELTEAAATCPKTPVQGPVAGTPPLAHALKRLHDKRLLPGSLALQVHITGKYGKRKIDETMVVVYQFHRDVLSVVYAYAAPGVTLAAQTRVALRAAAASAENLRRG